MSRFVYIPVVCIGPGIMLQQVEVEGRAHVVLAGAGSARNY